VYATDATRAHEADAGGAAGCERSPDSRRADGTLHDTGGQVARADLAGVGREPLELILRQPDADRAVEHPDRRRNGSSIADLSFGSQCDLDPLSGRKSVRRECRLERDDWLTRFERTRYFRDDLDHGIAPSFTTHRAAASAATSASTAG
jgi:hypothetical protein